MLPGDFGAEKERHHYSGWAMDLYRAQELAVGTKPIFPSSAFICVRPSLITWYVCLWEGSHQLGTAAAQDH